MNKKILLITSILMIPSMAISDAFVPNFDDMKNLRCDFEETVYDSNNTQVSISKQHRLYRIDAPYYKIYNNREPIDHVTYFGSDKIEFDLQSMNDESITMSHTLIDLINGKYSSSAEITYDNEVFGVQRSESSGVCKFLN